MSWYITLYHNGASLRISESFRLDCDPTVYLGAVDMVAGGVTMWNSDQIRICLTDEALDGEVN